MLLTNRAIAKALLLLAALVITAHPVQAKRPPALHLPHLPSLSPEKPAKPNPWAKPAATASSSAPLSSGSIYLMAGFAVALAAGYGTLRVLVKRARENPGTWSPQAPVRSGDEFSADDESFEARMREKLAELEKFRADAGFVPKPD